MKTKSFLFSLIIFIFSFTGCFSNWTGDDGLGSFSITFGNGSARTPLFGDDTIRIEDLVHTIKLFNGPGPDQIRGGVKFGQTANFTVQPGLWDISVKAYDGDNEIKAEALMERVEIKAGKNGPVSIAMKEPPPPVGPGEYDITMEDDGNGTATANPSPAAQGETVQISASPNNGYKFKEWDVFTGGVNLSPDKQTSPATFPMPGYTVTIKAVFEELPPDTPNLVMEPVTFAKVAAGYTQPDAETVTITNSGTGPAQVSGITLGGSYPPQFILWGHDDIIDTSIAAGATKTFTVQPNGGLGAGAYTATITVTYDDDQTANANLSFTVMAPTAVTVTPDGGTVVRGTTQQFNATVIFDGSVDPSANASQSVNWSVSGETGPVRGTSIDSNGLLTVDATVSAGTRLFVTATSTLDNAVACTVEVTVVNPALTGTVTITGDRYINGTVTATVTGLPAGADTLTYQWKNQGADISGATNPQYTLRPGTNGDLRRSITVEVKADGFDGSITAEVNPTGVGVSSASQWNEAATTILSRGAGYILVLQNFTASGPLQNLSVNTLDYQIEVYAEDSSKTIDFTGTGSLLAIPSGKYVVIRNVNLKGNADNAAPLVCVDGTLLLNGVEISGNTNTEGNGGGVYVASGGTLRFQKGTIYGNEDTSDPKANNVTEPGATGAALYVETGATAICVNLMGNTVDILDTTSETITGDHTNDLGP